MEVQPVKTSGVSPKATNAGIAALAAPLLVRVIASLLGVEIDSEALEGAILAVIGAGSALLAAYHSRPGNVVVNPQALGTQATPGPR